MPGRRRIQVALQAFGREAVEGQAERYGLSLAEFVELAAGHHISLQGSRRLVRDVPPFMRGDSDGATVELELSLERDAWRALDAQAARQGVPIGRLLGHAALALAAELDSGRVAARVIEP
jgi:hypothetical protein